MKAYIATDDTLSIVGPQIGWAGARDGRDGRDDAGRLPLSPVRRPCPVYVVAARLLVLVFVPSLERRRRRLGALAEARPAAGRPSGRVREARAWSSISPTGSRSAAAGSRASGAGTIPFLIIVAPIVALVFKEPDLGTTMVIGLTALTMFFVAGGGPDPSRGDRAGGVRRRSSLVGLRGYQLDRIRTWLDPWSDPLGAGFHTIQGLLALGLGGILGAGLGESRLAGGLFLPNASNDYIFAIIGEEFGLIGAGDRDRPVRRSGLLWHPRLARGPRHVRGAARGRASPPGCASRRSSTSASSSRSSR